MESITVHEMTNDLGEAAELYQKIRRRQEVELWEVEANGNRYAVISRVKQGRNPSVRLLERLDVKCPDCGGQAVTVWRKGATKALKCLRGHYEKNSKGELKAIHPVFLV